MPSTKPARFIPAPSVCIRSKLSPSVVYLYKTTAGKLAAVGYAGRTVKPTFHHSFGAADKRQTFVAAWMRDEDKKATAKAARRDAPHGLAVGDVLVASWGYEQTNVDFYQVVRLAGAKSVAIRPIKSEKHNDGDMTGYAVPLIDQFEGDARTVRPTSDGWVRINSHTHARKAERTTGADGQPLGYKPQRWTAYA